MDNPSMADVLVEYSKAVDAAWRKYCKVADAAWSDYRRALKAARDAGGADKDSNAARLKYQMISDSAWDEYIKTEYDGWFSVADKTSDPLARWIIKNCSNYREEATMVLEALPASLEELNEMASNQGWCGIWDGLVAQAQADGVI